MSEKLVYLMRGLPSCGKSTTATKLAGKSGVVLETDQFFYTEIGDDVAQYDYSDHLLPAARDWNFARFVQALQGKISPIVVDRGNGLNIETQRYARAAVEHQYSVHLKEPESPWWQELRVLLKYKQHVDGAVFDRWAEALSERSRETHRVPTRTIRSWMRAWRFDLTVEEILEYSPHQD